MTTGAPWQAPRPPWDSRGSGQRGVGAQQSSGSARGCTALQGPPWDPGHQEGCAIVSVGQKLHLWVLRHLAPVGGCHTGKSTPLNKKAYNNKMALSLPLPHPLRAGQLNFKGGNTVRGGL